MRLKNKNLFFIDDKKRIYFLHAQKIQNKYKLSLSESDNGFKFSDLEGDVQIKKSEKTNENVDKCSSFRVSKLGDEFLMTYEKLVGKAKTLKIYGAVSPDLKSWQSLKLLKGLDVAGAVVPDYFYDQDRVMYIERGNSIGIAYSDDLKKWNQHSSNILEPRADCFDNYRLIPANAFVRNREIILFYYHVDAKNRFSLGFAVINYDNPEKVLYRNEEPVWEQDKKVAFNPIAIVEIDGKFAVYWEKKNADVFMIILPPIHHYNEGDYYNTFPLRPKFRISLEKAKENPLLSPRTYHAWEALATFNPTVFELDGKFHILYRAMGYDAISSVGYAVSTDGITIDKRYDKPIYVPREPFEGVNGVEFDAHSTPRYMSGGGWGGCEDARATVINERLYILYAAFDGYNEPNVAISSISLDDFRNENWQKWDKPKLITNSLISTKNPAATEWTRADRPNAQYTGEKDAAVLPEKINGKYVIFHRIWPNIVIDYVDSLDFDGKTFLRGEHLIKIRPNMWDSAKVSLAATPIKTKEGWLMIYNAVDKRDPSKYKLGAMMLALDEPTKVLFRCTHQILEPVEHYENGGLKSGIVFSGGAIIKDGTLFVYYGGSDQHTCVATYNATEFIEKLKEDSALKIKKIEK